MAGKTSVVKVNQRKSCRPFTLNVMVFSPESGYKVEVVVEKGCSKKNDAIWKLVFDLFQKEKSAKEFVQLVHVSFEAKSPQEAQGIQSMAADGVSSDAAKVLNDEVFPAAKAVATAKNVTSTQKRTLSKALSKATTIELNL